MIKKFGAWIYRKLSQYHNEQNLIGKEVAVLSSTSESSFNRRKSMVFNVYFANGGIVVETRNYDKKRDEWDEKLYIVTEDQDLGEFLSRTITIESLTR